MNIKMKNRIKPSVYFFALLIISQSCHTAHRKKNTLGDYLKDKNINAIKIESFTKDSFDVLPNSSAIFAKMEKIKRSTGIWKYAPKRKLIIAYSSQKIDTLYTNGRIFQYGNLFFVHSAYLFKVSNKKAENHLNIAYAELVKDINLMKGLSDSCVLNIFDTIKAKALGGDDNFTSYQLLFNIAEKSDGWVSELCVSLISDLFVMDNKKFAAFYNSKQNPISSTFHQFLKEGLCIYIYNSNDPEKRKQKLLKMIANLSQGDSKSAFNKMINEIDKSFCD